MVFNFERDFIKVIVGILNICKKLDDVKMG